MLPTYSNIKVLKLIPFLPPHGGIQRLALEVGKRLVSSGMDVEILAALHPSRKSYQSILDQIKLYRIPAFCLLGRPVAPTLSVQLYKRLRHCKDISIVHIYTPITQDSLIAKFVKCLGIPLVITYAMDPILDRGITSLKKIVQWGYYIFSLLPALRTSQIIISTTHRYIELSPVLSRFREKCTVIPQGVDTNKFRPPKTAQDFMKLERFKKKNNLLGGKKIVLFVGRLVPYKGITNLLEAYGQDSFLQNKSLLLIVGDGPLKSELKEACRAFGLRNVKFLGKVPDEELVTAYWSASVSINPSTNNLESIPLTSLESLACGTQVIITDVGGNRELFAHNGSKKIGRLIHPGSTKEISAALRTALQRGKIHQDSCRDYALNFSWDNIIDSYIRLYEKVRQSYLGKKGGYFRGETCESYASTQYEDKWHQTTAMACKSTESI